MVTVEVAITGTFCEDGIDLRGYGLHAEYKFAAECTYVFIRNYEI